MTPVGPMIHIVDDDPSFLRAVSRLICASGFTVRTFDSAASFLSQLSPDIQGCVIADLRMPGVSGLELQDALLQAGNTLPVVFLTGDGDIPSSVHAMRHGAEDFLSKRAPKEKLLDAVNRALARDAHQRAHQARLHELRAPFDSLTPRDREVLDHVLSGQLNKQIARNLGIDERSVKRHRTNIMAKLQVQSVPELMDLVHAANLRDGDVHQTASLDASLPPPSLKGLYPACSPLRSLPAELHGQPTEHLRRRRR